MNIQKRSFFGIALFAFFPLILAMFFANTGLASDQWVNQDGYMSYLPLVLNTHTSHLLAFMYDRNIWTVEEDGTNLQKITYFANGEVHGFTWSPDGGKIAFVRSYFGADIYIVNADGSNLYRLTSGEHAGNIDWFESKIAFLRDVGQPYVKISYVELNDPAHPIMDISPKLELYGTERNPIFNLVLEWSPNGKWIALSNGTAYGIASSDGNNFIDRPVGNARWKNDSSHIIAPSVYGIFFFNPNNYSSGILSQAENHVAVYSPDDRYIIYCDDYALRRMKSDNTEHTVLRYIKATDPVWTPTGDKIAYLSWEPSIDFWARITGLHIINSDGSNPIQVIAGWAYEPEWQP